MGSRQIKFWSERHLVDNSLDKPLLLQNVTHVLIALQVGIDKVQLLLLVFVLKMKAFVDYLQPINCWVHVPEIIVEEWLRLIYIERAYF